MWLWVRGYLQLCKGFPEQGASGGSQLNQRNYLI